MFTLNEEIKKRIDEKAGPNSPDFWSQFLRARAYFIASCREAGQTDAEIFASLYMDGPQHVTRIRQGLSIE
jgi:hypothetical protein